MNPVAVNLARAIALDDMYEDNVCPGCKQDVTGWERWDLHFMPHKRLARGSLYYREMHGIPWPFSTDKVAGVCPWNRDYLTARAFRRAYIAAHADSVTAVGA